MNGLTQGSSTAGPGTALWIGDPTLPEFSPLVAFLQHQVPTLCSSLTDALASFHARDDIRLIILTTTAIGGDDAKVLQSLCERYPDATVVQVLGTWCERAGRTLHVNGNLHRVPWHAFRSWWIQRCSGSLSRSASSGPHADEPPALVDPRRLRIGIVAANEDIAEIHGTLFRAFQMTSRWLPSLTPTARLNAFDVFLWDESANGRARPAPLSELREAVSTRPIVALRSAVNLPYDSDANVISVGLPYYAEELISLVRFHVHCQHQTTTRLTRSA